MKETNVHRLLNKILLYSKSAILSLQSVTFLQSIGCRTPGRSQWPSCITRVSALAREWQIHFLKVEFACRRGEKYGSRKSRELQMVREHVVDRWKRRGKKASSGKEAGYNGVFEWSPSVLHSTPSTTTSTARME